MCIASHKFAEPDTLVVMMAFADRDALIGEAPDTYYFSLLAGAEATASWRSRI